MTEPKYKFMSFRANWAYVQKVKKLSAKLRMGTSETIRLALDEAIGKHLSPGYKGEIVVVNTKALDNILMALYDRIHELEFPKEQSYEEAAKAAKKVDELRKQGKYGEAEGIINDRAQKGLLTGYVYWPDKKEKLSPEEREKMLDERYPDRKKQ